MKVSPIEPLDLSNGLTINPRLKLTLTLFRSDPAVKPIDEWQIKLSLLSFLRRPPLSISIAEDSGDLSVRRRPDLHKRKRDDPVASGTLYIRDLGFLKEGNDEEDEERRLSEWKRMVLERLDGIELNIEGVGFEMRVEVPKGEDFEVMKREWEDFRRNTPRGVYRQVDTIIVKGVPSRWFAEPRVSSKPSMLVTHTIFSVIGKIRKLNVAGDDDLRRSPEESKGEIVSGLTCTAWVQFETYNDFYNAMKMLCGRSMQKDGSRLKVDYELHWDRDGFFENQRGSGRNHVQERVVNARNGTPRHRSQIIHAVSDGSRAKRFKE